MSTDLNELACHFGVALTPSVPQRVPIVVTLTALTRLPIPELKVAC
jgi:hypothetical protein